MLHTLRLAIPNVYLLTGERAILIDAGGPKDVPRIRAFLEAHRIDNLAAIVLTHGHWDHVGGAAELREHTKAAIVLHRGDVALVRSGIVPPRRVTRPLAWFIHRFIDRPFPPFVPDILVDDEMGLRSFGVEARILFTPGHTAGSLSVLSQSGDAVVGDLLFGGHLGGKLFASRPGLHYINEDLPQLHRSIAKLLATSPRRIHPVHGGPLDPAATIRIISVAYLMKAPRTV